MGEGENEAGVLLAVAYPDRVGVRRSKGGNFQLSGGVGAASVPGSDPLARAEVLAIAEMTSGDVGGGARNDRVRLAAPVPLTALEPDGDRPGCLADALCRRRDSVVGEREQGGGGPATAVRGRRGASGVSLPADAG